MSIRRSMPGATAEETTRARIAVYRHEYPRGRSTAQVCGERNGDGESASIGGEYGTKCDPSVRRSFVQDAGSREVQDHDDDGVERGDGERQTNNALPLCPKQPTEPAFGVETGDDRMKRGEQELPEAKSYGGSSEL